MTINCPDKWVMLKIESKKNLPLYKVFATWYGSYLHGDSWKANSGCTKVKQDGDFLLFYGYSGSVYKVYKKSYGTSGYSESILQHLLGKVAVVDAKIEVLPEETDWFSLRYGLV